MELTGAEGDMARLPFPDRPRVLLAAAVEPTTAPQELEEVLQRIVEGAATVAGAATPPSASAAVAADHGTSGMAPEPSDGLSREVHNPTGVRAASSATVYWKL